MSLREVTSHATIRIALAGLVVALSLCIWTGARAFQIADIAATPASINVVPGALDLPAAPAPVDVAAAVDADPFAPDRTAPAQRYRMPGEAVAAAPAAEPPKPSVLGTATAGDGSSFATVQFQSSRLLMVRVGDHVGDYIVKSIGRGVVTFATPAGKTFDVLAPKVGG